MEVWYVYLLECIDGKLYTGCTNNLKDRISRHEKGLVSYTKTRLPVILKSFTGFRDKHKAFEYEKYLKSGSGKAFAKKRLI